MRALLDAWCVTGRVTAGRRRRCAPPLNRLPAWRADKQAGLPVYCLLCTACPTINRHAIMVGPESELDLGREAFQQVLAAVCAACVVSSGLPGGWMDMKQDSGRALACLLLCALRSAWCILCAQNSLPIHHHPNQRPKCARTHHAAPACAAVAPLPCCLAVSAIGHPPAPAAVYRCWQRQSSRGRCCRRATPPARQCAASALASRRCGGGGGGGGVPSVGAWAGLGCSTRNCTCIPLFSHAAACGAPRCASPPPSAATCPANRTSSPMRRQSLTAAPVAVTTAPNHAPSPPLPPLDFQHQFLIHLPNTNRRQPPTAASAGTTTRPSPFSLPHLSIPNSPPQHQSQAATDGYGGGPHNPSLPLLSPPLFSS